MQMRRVIRTSREDEFEGAVGYPMDGWVFIGIAGTVSYDISIHISKSMFLYMSIVLLLLYFK